VTTTRLIIKQIALECEGATITVLSARNEWSDRQELCLEITSAETANHDPEAAHPDDAELPLYSTQPDVLAPRSPPNKNPTASRRRALLLLAVIATTALLVGFAVAANRRPRNGALSATPAPTNHANALGSDGPTTTDPTAVTISRALGADSTNLTLACRDVLTAAAAALDTDDSSLLRSLIADHQGQTLNDALHQQLTDARAALASRLSRGTSSLWSTGGLDALDATISSLWSADGLDFLDGTIAYVDATHCSPRDDGRVTSPAPISVKAK
jgi:hypothetical protein